MRDEYGETESSFGPMFVQCSLGVIVNSEFTFQELHGTFLILTLPGFEFAITGRAIM
jgi:hypothetical protein